MYAAEHHQLLLADDDPEECYLMHLALTDIGWSQSVRFFSSAEAVLAYLAPLPQEQFPALILLDRNLPRQGTAALMQVLKQSKTYCHLPIVVYAAEANSILEQQLVAAGARHCFAKARNYTEALSLAETLRLLAMSEASA